ncbi:hypothetical protein TPHA_0P00180 [Tetrapisispora phaffii CBS 4417]|uniref:Mediator of RNA polymerase II transcription subunit 14 n=1 Tax=Tetrapisispora phaffii (strain ATCC 24235 / CBS 4417 / NBRC 1672 / NRRL Y-8282 / UCD 70-5) TaxID=1071381 RepID=G8C1Z8_TETPH|nr:hypothetical protein TPHA_0P00180 [Tetrapisispora phaffii CBS 4417]CCE66176.1 hypothetical protein TPHA_0P00180 [Tetrapisispora phaffii CBS 4417]
MPDVVEHTAPPLPHVEINQAPLSMVIRNLTVFTIKELSQFIKTNVHVNTNSQEPSSARKINFLQLVIFLRNQFLKLYVLIKWCRTIKGNNFHVLIDLLNWFRTANMTVNNCIWALKNNLITMTNAKLPNADLTTALEVLSLGRPNLPTHNFKMSGEDSSTVLENGALKIPPKLILRRLYDLNLNISIKLSMMDIPPQMKNYRIKDGRVFITVLDEFEIQLATIDSQHPLFFVDLTLLLNNQYLHLNKPRFEKVINDLLHKTEEPLYELYIFLHKYVVTLKLYLIHIELTSLESNGKFFGGNLVHRYDAKKSVITVRYWLNARMGNKGKITIGIDKESNNLVLRWNNEIARGINALPVVYTNILSNIENILDEVMFNHSHLIRAELLSNGIFQEDEENSDVLLFQIPTTCISVAPVQLKIDLISGIFYFKNSTTLLQSYAQQINKSDSIKELTLVLQRLRLDKITYILQNMFEKTGWVCSKVVELEKPIKSHVNTNRSKDNSFNLLQKDIFISLPNWPTHWYLIITVVSSKTSCIIEKRISKILAVKGKWELKYLEDSSVTANLETITYQKIMNLQRTILHKIINHMLIDSLNQLKIKNKICSSSAISSQLPKYVVDDQSIKEGSIFQSTSQKQNSLGYISVIALELTSFLDNSDTAGQIFESSLLLKIDYGKSQIKLFGKFVIDTMMTKFEPENLNINFIKDDPKAFYLDATFMNMNNIVQYLSKFKNNLMQLVSLTDVVERLRKNFESEHFKILNLQPNEVAFKYFEKSTNEPDCTIKIISNDEVIENLQVQLSPSSPQYIIQKFLDDSHMHFHFIFNYLQFTSSLFTSLDLIQNEKKSGLYQNFTKVTVGLHNLNEYQLMYHNPEAGTKISITIELKIVSHNGQKKIQYYVHFSEDNISTKSLAYPLVHKIRQQVFILDKESKDTTLHKNTVRLVNGIACDATSIEAVLLEIHGILKKDSNISDSGTNITAANLDLGATENADTLKIQNQNTITV